MDTITKFLDTFYGILSSGLTEKTKLSFSSSNSSFTHCVRKHNPHYLASSSNTYGVTDDLHWWMDELFSDNTKKPISSSSTEGDYSFTSCTFTTLTSDSNGGAIFFSLSGTLTISSSIFELCSNIVPENLFEGGGAVCVQTGYLIAHRNIFILCTTPYLGGGLLVQSDCVSSIVSLSTFISCKAGHGGGLTTYWGPKSLVSSSRFISCIASISGGGIYHNSGSTESFLTISNSLFKDNNAQTKDSNVRGGGAFEDYRSSEYQSEYSFLFCSGNKASSGKGNDISVQWNKVTESSFIHSFTLEISTSFWNNNSHIDWLPSGTVKYVKNLDGNMGKCSQ